ncbi:MAG: DNA primase [Deltaproteobacteria bacterium]|nr:DNA primase [Deltaproteobacteria bacterium]
MTENKDQAEKDFSKFVMDCLLANELGDGTLYAALNDGRFVFNKSSQEWMAWQDHFWALDEMDQAHIAVEDVALSYLAEARSLVEDISKAIKEKNESATKTLKGRQGQIYKRVKRLRSDRGRINCLCMAHKNGERPLAILGEHLDQSPWLLACANGVVDLRTGELQPGRPSDYLTKASPTEWDSINAPCPIWEKTLSEIFAGEPELVAYVARLFGYALTGVPKENILPILWGQGRNGKTTIVETISRILGPLAAPIQSEMLLDQGHSRSSAGPSPDIMALKGLRMAFASEADEGRKFSPSRIKWLSGSDTLVGRAPHDRRQTSFRPTHTLILLTNHKPHAPASDFAFWERIHLIPFNYSFVDRAPQKDNEFRADKDLSDKLEAEATGILAWMVRGCLQWQQMGLNPPDIIRDATDEYRRDEDLLADFIEDRCYIHPDAFVHASALYDDFKQWFENNVSKRPFSQKKFGNLLKDRFEKEKKGTVIYHGLRLLEP